MWIGKKDKEKEKRPMEKYRSNKLWWMNEKKEKMLLELNHPTVFGCPTNLKYDYFRYYKKVEYYGCNLNLGLVRIARFDPTKTGLFFWLFFH